MTLQIGDVVEWPADQPHDPYLIRIAMLQRGRIRKASTARAKNVRIKQAHMIMAEHDAAQHRATDPYELAKLYLGRRGYAVFDRRLVYGATFRGFQVGRRVVDTAQDVIDYARELGWGG